MYSIYVGFDPREAAAFAVCCRSIRQHLSIDIPIRGLVLPRLQASGLYKRPHSWVTVDNRLVMMDMISNAKMSTQHANARFLVPYLAHHGWALFCDGDILFRADVAPLFDSLDTRKAVYCVKHDYRPMNERKMDGQVQSQYFRKNWSSFIFFNCDHEANQALTVEMVNTRPGRDLHRLCWIKDDDLIGEIGPVWNWLVGHSDPNLDPKCVHFTEGVPDMPGYENVSFAEEWRQSLYDWAERRS